MSFCKNHKDSPVIFNIFKCNEEGLKLITRGHRNDKFHGRFTVIHNENVFTDFEEGDYLI